MNIAIVIGVSSYSHNHEIAAPKEVANRIKKLLDATGKYQDILYIIDNTLAANVKNQIRSFLQSHEQVEIEEVFYYFSGHGQFIDQEFYMLCSDFEKSKLKMTSLQNSEIDDFIRQLNPKLTVKIIDACFSGYRYLKDDSRDYYSNLSSDNQLKDVIFMASSHDDQKSQMMDQDSYFTTKFIEGALSVNIGGQILYRDIQAFIADEFNSMTSQRPFFVNQGQGTEVFAKYTVEMKALKEELYPENIQEVGSEYLNNNYQDNIRTESEYLTEEKLIEKIDMIVSEKDSLFVDKAIINNSILKMKTDILNYKVTDQIVSNFYQLSFDWSKKLSHLSQSGEILRMADIEEWPQEYLVRVPKRKIKVPVSNLQRTLFGLGEDTKEVEKPVSLVALNPLAYEVIKIRLEPINKLSLYPFLLIIALVHSETHIMTLSNRGMMIKDGWQSYAPDWNSLSWYREESLWKKIIDNTDVLWRVLLDETIQETREYLMSHCKN